MSRSRHEPVPPVILYLEVNVLLPGVSPVMTLVALARVKLLPCT